MKPGRPKKTLIEKKSTMLLIRLNEAEQKRIEDAAAKADKKLATWARETLLAASGT